MKINKYSLAILASAALPLTAVSAGDSGWYIGIGGGVSTVDEIVDPEDLAYATAEALDIYNFVGTTNYSTDDEGTIFKVFGGYEFNPYFSIEGFYADLGEAKSKTVSNGYSESYHDAFVGTISTTATYSATVLGTAAVGTIPLTEKFSIYGKVGTFAYDAAVDVNVKMNGNSYYQGEVQLSESEEISDTGAGYLVGLGMGYAISDNWEVKLDIERYGLIKIEDAESNVDTITANVIYKF